jgi:hypothetical protein
MKIWDYTERTLVSFKVWKIHVKAEMTYRHSSNHKGWASFKGENPITSGLATTGKGI